MKTSSFLASLRSHAGLPLVFRAGRALVSSGYHLTEVKRVAYETMDCGAMTHRWSESQFELWVPPSADIAPGRGHMAAGKFLRIVERVEAELPLDGDATARVHAAFDGQPAALHAIDSIDVRDGRLWVELSPDKTRCKAAERRLAAAPGGCGGVGSAQPDAKEAAPGCCGATNAAAATAACGA